MVDNLNPMDLLKQELDSDEVAARVNCIHKLRIVGTLLGVDGIKNVLLPYLDGLIRKEQDEVLFAIAEQLGVLAPMLGNHQMAVMPILQGLCGQDQTVVRDMAVKSLIGIMANATDADINNYFTPMIMRLAINEANFTCRVSAANLMCKVYKRAGPGKDKIRQKFSELSNEETPMVRRVIAVKIGEMATVYEKEFIVSDLIPAFKQLSNDDQDLVRVLCLDSLNSLAKVLSRQDNKTHMLPVIIQAAEDKSWRVRLALSKNFAQIAQSFGKQITDLSLVQTFSTLLKDVQNDVKIQAVKSLSRFVRLVSSDKLTILMPLIMTLGKDSSSIVRSNVTSVLCNVVSLVPKDQAYQKLLPLISDMMKDDNQDVRQGAIRAISKFGESVGHDILNSILPLLKVAAEDPKWRVRNQVIHAIVSLAMAYQNYEIFITKNLEQLYLYYLKDKAAAVREFGIEKIPQLVKAFGNNWINSFITKLADIISKDSGYTAKITAIYSLQMLAMSPGGQVAVDKVFGLVSKSLTDSVPNVRLVSAKALRQLAHKYDGLREPVKKTLAALSEDPDKDVKFYVLEAVNGI